MTTQDGAMPTLAVIAQRLAAATPRLAPPASVPSAHASVAIVLREDESGVSILFIERSRREGDLWSGDMAFPGGRADERDADAEATARRETFEELGLTLAPPIGRLDDFDSRSRRRNFEIVVSPFVYAVSLLPKLVFSEEVASAVWIPLHHLISDAARTTFERRFGEGVQRMPALRHEERVIWGMTYEMLGSLTRHFGAHER